MSSGRYCCVPGCKESGGMHQVLHGFPNPKFDRERFNTWLYAIGSHEMLGLKNEQILNRRVCRAHFEDKYLCRNNRISNIAVPTLKMPALLIQPTFMSTNRHPLQQIENLPSTSALLPQPTFMSTNRLPLKQIENLPSTSSALLPQPTFMSTNRLPLKQIENLPSTSSALLPQPTFMSTNRLPLEQIENLPSTSSDLTATMQEEIALPSTPQTNMQLSLGRQTTVRKTKKRVFLTNTEKELHRKLVAARIRISKIKNKVKKLSANVKAAKRIASNPAVFDMLENCTSTAKLLISMQCREDHKKEKGRRFTLKEKIASLSIYKQSPKGYRFLRKFFILPAHQTLIKLVQICNIKPGINKNVFSQLKNKADNMKPEEKLCVVLFDEVSLKNNLTYNARKDKITGLVDNGQERKCEFADHAQVFMLRGLIHNYKQAVSYTFASSATKGPELAKQIKEVIGDLQEAGFTVVATVCDQGTNNRQALNLLLNETRGIYLRKGEEPKDCIILINGQEIVPLYDPPHLLKGIRNNLMTKNLEYTIDGETKTAKWSHLKLLLNENPGYKGVRLIPKLTEYHVNPLKINKQKVKFASQIFSRTVASNMGYLADKNILPTECKDTADLLLFMDNIFDSVNGSQQKNKNAKPLLGPATPNSAHHKTWLEGVQIFQSMKFVAGNGRKQLVPSVTNWVWTLNGIQTLLKKLHNDFNVSSVWLRHLNQDPLENFFGAVRSQGCRNTNPTCDQFESAFVTLLINNISSVQTRGNCEKDFCDALHSLIINENVKATSTCSTFDFAKIFDFNFTPLEVKESDPRIIAPLQYMSGYFLKKIKSKIFKACTDCCNDFSSKDEIEYIKYREYAGRRWLCTPSKNFIEVISNIQDLINEIIKENIERPNLKIIINTSISIFVNFDFIKCKIHKEKVIDYLINIVIRCMIFNYCKNINKILAGRKDVDDCDDKLQTKAKKLNDGYKKHK